jgi:hypothetical protein
MIFKYKMGYERELANNDLEYQAGLIANENSINIK